MYNGKAPLSQPIQWHGLSDTPPSVDDPVILVSISHTHLLQRAALQYLLLSHIRFFPHQLSFALTFTPTFRLPLHFSRCNYIDISIDIDVGWMHPNAQY